MRKRSRIKKTGDHLTCSREPRASEPAFLDAWIETVELHDGTRLLVRSAMSQQQASPQREREVRSAASPALQGKP